MTSYNLLLTPVIGLCLFSAHFISAQPMKPQEVAPPSTQRNPFEEVPKPAEPPLTKGAGPTIEAIEFHGVSRVGQIALRGIIASRVGDAFDLETLRRDAQALYKTDRFADVFWRTNTGPAGVIVSFKFVPRPLIQALEVRGDDTVTVEGIIERFKERKINLRVDTLLHEDELGRAAATVRELVAERGRQNIIVTPSVEPTASPAGVKIAFVVKDNG